MSNRLEELVSAQVRLRADACAIAEDVRRVSYREIGRRSDRFANALVALGLQPDDRVCLLVPKSAEGIVTILGVLKAGGVYTPLDVTSPAPRLGHVLQALAPCWLIVQPDFAGLALQCLGELKNPSALKVCWLGDVPAGFEGQAGLSLEELGDGDGDGASPPVQAAPGGLACILFTSGSTGQPKGVPITHDGLIHFISWANTHFGLGAEDRISGHAPLHFDMSVWDIFGALSSGAELHLVPARANLLPNLIAEFIRDRKLTQWYSVSSVLTAMAKRDVVAQGDFPALRRLIWGAEVFPTAAVRYWMERLPHVEFTNTYGPTETTVFCSHHTVSSVPDDTSAPIPIGTAIAGKKLAVLASDRRPAAVDVIGDLYIGGAGLSPGYWRDPEKTAAAFFELPPGSGDRWYRTGDLARRDPAGVLHFHGRADRQVKSRGYRIELDEIAAALSRLAGVAESAVVAIPVDGFEGTAICAAYVPLPGAERSPVELRRDLAATLPSYMLPTRWLAPDSLPRNQNGKIDHRLLEQWFLDQR